MTPAILIMFNPVRMPAVAAVSRCDSRQLYTHTHLFTQLAETINKSDLPRPATDNTEIGRY